MAEAVQAQLEEMLPELHEFEQKGLFSKAEIKQIVKKRTAFEYALRRRQPEKRDFLRYIEYELNLDLLRRKRKERLGVTKKNSNGEFAIQRRIHFIFHRAEQKFKGDVALWLQHVDFCKRTGASRMLNKVFAQALQFHPANASLWVLAAKWEFEETGNVNTARVLMQRGIRLNTESRLLWREYFRLELTYVERLRARRKILGIGAKDAGSDARLKATGESLAIPAVAGEEDAAAHDSTTAEATPLEIVLSGAIPRVVYTNAVAALSGDADLRMALANICRQFPDDVAILDQIYSDLARDFASNETVRAFIAVRPYDDALASGDDTRVNAGEMAASRNLYATAESLGTSAMYDAAGAFHLRLLGNVSAAPASATTTNATDVSATKDEDSDSEGDDDSPATASAWRSSGLLSRERADFHMDRLIELSSHAIERGVASEWLLGERVAALVDVGEVTKALECAREATDGGKHKEKKAVTKSAAVWLLRLRLEIAEAAASHANARQFVDASHRAFSRAVTCVEGNGLVNLYELWIEYCCALGDAHKTADCFEAAVRIHGNQDLNALVSRVKLQYIEWACMSGGIERAREVYSRLLAMLSVPIELLMRCIAVENSQPLPDRARIVHLYERAVSSYGSNNAELWLEYISSELSHGRPEEVGNLYWRALKHLDDASTFVQCYNVLRVSGSTH